MILIYYQQILYLQEEFYQLCYYIRAKIQLHFVSLDSVHHDYWSLTSFQHIVLFNSLAVQFQRKYCQLFSVL